MDQNPLLIIDQPSFANFVVVSAPVFDQNNFEMSDQNTFLNCFIDAGCAEIPISVCSIVRHISRVSHSQLLLVWQIMNCCCRVNFYMLNFNLNNFKIPTREFKISSASESS